MASIIYIVLHIVSVIASLAAGLLWMRSASVKVPSLVIDEQLMTEFSESSDRWVGKVASDLNHHRSVLQLATKFNMAAAASASVAAIAQAMVFALNAAIEFAKL